MCSAYLHGKLCNCGSPTNLHRSALHAKIYPRKIACEKQQAKKWVFRPSHALQRSPLFVLRGVSEAEPASLLSFNGGEIDSGALLFQFPTATVYSMLSDTCIHTNTRPLCHIVPCCTVYKHTEASYSTYTVGWSWVCKGGADQCTAHKKCPKNQCVILGILFEKWERIFGKGFPNKEMWLIISIGKNVSIWHASTLPRNEELFPLLKKQEERWLF